MSFDFAPLSKMANDDVEGFVALYRRYKALDDRCFRLIARCQDLQARGATKMLPVARQIQNEVWQEAYRVKQSIFRMYGIQPHDLDEIGESVFRILGITS